MKLFVWMKSVLRKVPGFRRMSSSSMVIAATWYGAAILTMVKYWYWGLALLALPFLLINLADRGVLGSTRWRTAAAITAGVLVLAGLAGGIVSATSGPAGGGAGPAMGPVETARPAAPSQALPSAASAALPEGSRLRSTAPAVAETVSPALSPSVMVSLSPALSPSSVPPATQPAAQGEYAYVASKTSEVFHEPGCSSAKRIKPGNLIGFTTRQEALARGLRPCKKCKP